MNKNVTKGFKGCCTRSADLNIYEPVFYKRPLNGIRISVSTVNYLIFGCSFFLGIPRNIGMIISVKVRNRGTSIVD